MDLFSLMLIVICFLTFLFTLFAIANDDFILLRKHVTATKVFDIAFLTLFIGIFSARIFYVVFHFSPGFLNPLVFFIFPYFPGLSVPGGIIGGLMFLALYALATKLPMDRIFDVFSLSLFSVLPIGILMELLISRKFFVSLAFGGAFIISVLLLIVILRLFHKGDLKDGSISFFSLFSFSAIAFFAGFIQKKEKWIYFLNKDDILYLVIFFIAVGFFIKQERIFFRIKRLLGM